MSDQLTSQSRPSSGISRRTALRGAAWSASAVTVVVATPNIAAASGGSKGTAGTTTAIRSGNTLYVTSSLTAASAALSSVQARVTVSFDPVGASIKSTSAQSPWVTTGSTELTATFTAASVPAGGTLSFKPELVLKDASDVDGTISIHYTWDGNADGATAVGTFTKN